MSIKLCFVFFSLFKSNEESNLWGRCSDKKCIAGLPKSILQCRMFIMANSLIQGGPSPAIFADWCYNYIASKEHFPPTDFSLPEQFKERRDIKKVNLFFFFILRLNYVISGYRNVHDQMWGSNPTNKYSCSETTMETGNMCDTWDLFKVNNKDTRTVLVLLWCFFCEI